MKRFWSLLASLLFAGTTLAGNTPVIHDVKPPVRSRDLIILGGAVIERFQKDCWKKAFAFADQLEEEAELERIKAEARWYDPLKPFLAHVLWVAKQSNKVSIWVMQRVKGKAELIAWNTWLDKSLRKAEARQQTIDRMISQRANDRMIQLLNESADLRQAREEGHRFWMNNQPSVLTYERLNDQVTEQLNGNAGKRPARSKKPCFHAEP